METIFKFIFPLVFGGALWFIGFSMGRLKPKQFVLKDKSFRWFDLSKDKLPDGETAILVYCESNFTEYRFSVERVHRLSYDKEGYPTYLGSRITHWAYLPTPKV